MAKEAEIVQLTCCFIVIYEENLSQVSFFFRFSAGVQPEPVCGSRNGLQKYKLFGKMLRPRCKYKPAALIQFCQYVVITFITLFKKKKNAVVLVPLLSTGGDKVNTT